MSCTRDTPRCDTATSYLHNLPDCCRSHIVDIMRAMRSLLRQANIPWWIDYGTLLGAVRNGGIIPWDKDGDCGFLASDLPRFRALSANWTGRSGQIPTSSGPLHVVRKNTNNMKVRWSATNHTNIDFFYWTERANGTLYREKYASVDRYKGRAFHRDRLFPLSTIKWEGLTLPAPRDPEWWCEFRYGADWREPIRANNDKLARNDDGSLTGEPRPTIGGK